MTPTMSEVVGIIEVDLDSDELQLWLVNNTVDTPRWLASAADEFDSKISAVTNDRVVADVAQLNAELRSELAKVLTRLPSQRPA